jgi:hypothetical protein
VTPMRAGGRKSLRPSGRRPPRGPISICASLGLFPWGEGDTGQGRGGFNLWRLSAVDRRAASRRNFEGSPSKKRVMETE